MLGERSDPPGLPLVSLLGRAAVSTNERRGGLIRITDRRNQSRRARFLLTFPFASLASTLAKYSSEPFGSAFIVLLPSFQFAGQTSPCSSCEEQVMVRDGGS